MRRPRLTFVETILVFNALFLCAHADEYTRLEVTPAEVTLEGKDSSIQLLVTGYDAEGRPTDLTHEAEYESDSDIVRANSFGCLLYTSAAADE